MPTIRVSLYLSPPPPPPWPPPPQAPRNATPAPAAATPRNSRREILRPTLAYLLTCPPFPETNSSCILPTPALRRSGAAGRCRRPRAGPCQWRPPARRLGRPL